MIYEEWAFQEGDYATVGCIVTKKQRKVVALAQAIYPEGSIGLDKEIAEHIVDIHNEWLRLQPDEY